MLESVQTFFAMGGYGAFVWSAYAITFVVLIANLLINGSSHKRLVTRLKKERMLKSGTATDSMSKTSSAAENTAIPGSNTSKTQKGAA